MSFEYGCFCLFIFCEVHVELTQMMLNDNIKLQHAILLYDWCVDYVFGVAVAETLLHFSLYVRFRFCLFFYFLLLFIVHVHTHSDNDLVENFWYWFSLLCFTSEFWMLLYHLAGVWSCCTPKFIQYNYFNVHITTSIMGFVTDTLLLIILFCLIE